MSGPSAMGWIWMAPPGSPRTGRVQPLGPASGASGLSGAAVRAAMVGAGGFAQATLLPIIRSEQALFSLKSVCSRQGHNAAAIAKQFGAPEATTDFDAVLGNADVDAVMIATRHHQHGNMVLKALQARKHVFVEKPLCLTQAELEQALAKKFRSEYLRNPKVTVTIATLRPFYMMGEVEKPGEYAYRSGLNVLTALAIAGGPTYRANRSTVQIQRRGENLKRDYPISASVPVLPGDVIRVPERYF